MKETFSNNLKQYRKQKQLSQEQLAEQLDITTQAVSKWECGLSYPDIDLLPKLADLFGVSIDTLLRGTADTGQSDSSPFPQPDLPDDNVLRIVQYRGKTLLRKDTYDPNIRIPLSIICEPEVKAGTRKFFFQNRISVSITKSDTASAPIQIWGSADIFGDLGGSVCAGHSVSCSGDINGSVDAGGPVTCSGDINGDANAGQDVSCGGDINGCASCEGSSHITCEGDISGDVSASGSITCAGDINGSVSARGSITCAGDLNGDASAGGSLSCSGDISGDASAGGNFSCEGDITGGVSAGGTVTCGGNIL